FIAAAAIGGALAWALITRPDDRRISLLAGLFCLGQIMAWALFVSVAIPGFSGTPERIETIALVSKAAEFAGVALAFRLSHLPRLGTLGQPKLAALPGWQHHHRRAPRPREICCRAASSVACGR